MDYKDTLNLPQTNFSMRANLPQNEPKQVEKWDREQTYFKVLDANQGKPRFVLHDGPPYANGNIHIGHALNKILKDIIVKYKSMTGHSTPYVPGWDCHGLPIELQVEKNIGRAKKLALSKVEIRRLCKEYAEKYISSSETSSHDSVSWAIGKIPIAPLIPLTKRRRLESLARSFSRECFIAGRNRFIGVPRA